jgi:transposase InsO family protein
MDFKGYFATGDGKRCDPFTITDAHSRYLIRCQLVSRMDLSQVRAICEAAMREYGVPARIRTDNGERSENSTWKRFVLELHVEWSEFAAGYDHSAIQDVWWPTPQ